MITEQGHIMPAGQMEVNSLEVAALIKVSIFAFHAIKLMVSFRECLGK